VRHRLFDVVARRLVEAAGDRPLVILLDDLHWADPRSGSRAGSTAGGLAGGAPAAG
jgi:hypothetical protein